MINIHKGDHSSKVPRYVMDISDIVNDFVAAVAKYIRYTDKYFLEIRVISRKKHCVHTFEGGGGRAIELCLGGGAGAGVLFRFSTSSRAASIPPCLSIKS